MPVSTTKLRADRADASAVLSGQPCPLTYHQKNQSHPAVTSTIHGTDGVVRMFRITARLGGIAPIDTTTSATRIPRTIAGNRFHKRANID
jgi:hypothetical protein